MIRNYVTFYPKTHKLEPMKNLTKRIIRSDEKHPFELMKRITTAKKQVKYARAAAGGSPPPDDWSKFFNLPFTKKIGNINKIILNTQPKKFLSEFTKF